MSSEQAANGVSKESGMTGITDPRDSDVLCGRGGAALRHPGNQTYRRLVNLNKGLYITCLKTEKLKISRSIVAAIREQNGRFLEKDNAKGSWFDIGDKKAIEKTSQALREGQPKLRQKIVEMGGGAAGTAALMEQQFGANGMYGQNAAVAQHGGVVGHQHHAMQQQQAAVQNMRGFDPTNLAQQMRVSAGGQVGAAMAGMMNPNPQHAMSSAMRHPGQTHQQPQNSLQQFRQQQHHLQQQQQLQQQQILQQQQHQQQMHQDMPPPQARQALHNEMMRLSMHGNDDDPQQQQQQQQQVPNNVNSRGGMNNSNNIADAPPLRPSLVKQRGSAAAAAAELAMGIQSSNMSLMSDFSFSNHTGSQFTGPAGSMFSMESSASGSAGKRGSGASSHGDPFGNPNNPYGNPYGNQQDVDRRRIFAKMKFTRSPSDRMSGRHIGGASAHSSGDGMPDFHMVESQLSLYSNLSGMTGNESRRAMAAAAAASAGLDGETKRPPNDLLSGAGSRHSIMSGLSRISDTSEVHSIFSDLSRKIGNVSTRSIAMSEISGIDAYRGGEDSDSTPSFGEAEPRTAASGTMDFDCF